jgi:hypothetical protein
MFEVKIKIRFQNKDVLVEEEKPREPTREEDQSKGVSNSKEKI